jgi:hypothetical protein
MVKQYKRLQITDERIEAVFGDLTKALERRLRKHGRLSFIGPHEIFGILSEEVHELEHEIRNNDTAKTYQELLDVAIATIWGLVSIDTIDKHQNNCSENRDFS